MSPSDWKEIIAGVMFLTTCGVLMAGFPVAFTLGGVSLVFGLFGHIIGVFDLAFVANLPSRIFGTIDNQVLYAVPLFVFMGVMLERSRIVPKALPIVSSSSSAMRERSRITTMKTNSGTA